MNERQMKKKINPERKFDLSELSCDAGEFFPFSVYAQYLSLGQAAHQKTGRHGQGERDRLEPNDQRETREKVIARRRGLEHA